MKDSTSQENDVCFICRKCPVFTGGGKIIGPIRYRIGNDSDITLCLICYTNLQLVLKGKKEPDIRTMLLLTCCGVEQQIADRRTAYLSAHKEPSEN